MESEKKLRKLKEEAEDLLKTEKHLKIKEIINYVGLGIILCIDLIITIVLLKYRGWYFNFNINFLNSLELGFLAIKFIGLALVFAFNLRLIKESIKYWNKFTIKREDIKEEAEEKLKRTGLIKRLWFYWRVYEARSTLDKLNGIMLKMERKIGKIKGNETKELKKLKREMILGILLWNDNFAITQMHKNSKGEKIQTNLRVTEEFLEQLDTNELWEDYLLPALVESAKFINGTSKGEIIEWV